MVIQNVLYPVTMQQEKNAFQSSQKVQNQDPAKEDQNNGQGGVILSISADALQMMQQEQAGTVSTVSELYSDDNEKSQASQENADAVGNPLDDMSKAMEIARRIMEGGKVPSKDESFLMEYNYEMYAAAKNMALLNQEEQKKYGSVLDDQEDSSGSGDKSVQDTDSTCTSIDASQVVQKIG